MRTGQNVTRSNVKAVHVISLKSEEDWVGVGCDGGGGGVGGGLNLNEPRKRNRQK